eukprot:gene13807-19723_t
MHSGAQEGANAKVPAEIERFVFRSVDNSRLTSDHDYYNGQPSEEPDEGDALLDEAPRPPPLRSQWNWLPCLLFAFFLCSCGFYLYIRIISLEAKLPAGAMRTVYLLDDGNSPEKRAFIESFNSPEELVVVFDANMRAKPDFFLKISDPSIKHNNKQFWEYWLPGAFGWGYIACTGTTLTSDPCNRPLATITPGAWSEAQGVLTGYLPHKRYVAEEKATLRLLNVFEQAYQFMGLRDMSKVFFSSQNALISPDHNSAVIRDCEHQHPEIESSHPGPPPQHTARPGPTKRQGGHAVPVWIRKSCYPLQTQPPPGHSINVRACGNLKVTNKKEGAGGATFIAPKVEPGKVRSVMQSIKRSASVISQRLTSMMGIAPDTRVKLVMQSIKRSASVILQRVASMMGMAPDTRKKTATYASTCKSVGEAYPLVGNDESVKNRREWGNSAWKSMGAPGHEDSLADNKWGANWKSVGAPTSGAALFLTSRQDVSQEYDVQPDMQTQMQMQGSMKLGGAYSQRLDLPPFNPSVAGTSGLSDKFSCRHNGSVADKFSRDVLRADNHMSTSPHGSPSRRPTALKSIAPVAPPPSRPQGSFNEGSRLKRVIQSFKPQNMEDFGEMLDPVALLLMFIFNITVAALGIWQLTMLDPVALLFMFIFNITVAALGIWQLTVNAPNTRNNDFAFGSPLSGSPYLVIATLWALHNSVAPYLFLHYCASAGRSFKFMTKFLSIATTLTMLCAIVFIWLLIPEDYNPREALTLGLNHLYPNSIPMDTNTNYAFVTGLNMAPVQFLNKVDLSGGMLVSDHVKYGFPTAYSIATLAWGYIQFPNGYKKDEDKLALMETLRSGADYLIRCNLKPGDTQNPLWVAQVGNGADYITLEDKGFDPETHGSVWTAPLEDPQLVGDERRLVWVLSKNAVGADLLAGYAAALSAVSMVFRETDPLFSHKALTYAEEAYKLATLNDLSPESYCQHVPCTHNVSVLEELVARPAEAASDNETAVCWYVDWLTKSCRLGNSMETCIWRHSEIDDVYTTRLACCNVLFEAATWDTLYTKAQGVCAVPEDEWTCYVPDVSQRTCYSEKIDRSTGAGCVGKGMEVFASPDACCNYMSREGFIDASNGKPGSGSCSQEKVDSNFGSCYVPSLADRQCLLRTGDDCDFFGTENSFQDSVGCCNRLLVMMAGLVPQAGSNDDKAEATYEPIGMCKFTNISKVSTTDEATPSANSSAAADARKLLKARRLLKDEESTVKRTPVRSSGIRFASSIIDEKNLWTIPILNGTALCDRDSKCEEVRVAAVREVALYNSTSIFDDLAWGGIWMYKASGNTKYLGQAQRFIQRHYQEDITSETLRRDRHYYVSDWDNLAWASNVLLAQITDAEIYITRIKTLLSAWVYGDALPSEHLIPNVGTGSDPENPKLENFTDPVTNKTYEIIPACTPTAAFEDSCDDNIDNDCNGKVDKEDVACGLFPVLYTPAQLAYSSSPSLPHAANAAFIAMVYSSIASGRAKSSIRCWALNQVNYMVGGVQGVRSYVVGFNNNPPMIVQQRSSSCPPHVENRSKYHNNPDNCSFSSGYWPGTPNPQLDLIKGGLVWGPGLEDGYNNTRQSDDTRLTIDGTVGLTSTLAALLDTKTQHKTCQLLHGVFQHYIVVDNTL